MISGILLPNWRPHGQSCRGERTVKAAKEDLATVHAIHSLASQIQGDVERFLSKIEGYQGKIGSAGRLTSQNWSLAVRRGFAVKMAITSDANFCRGTTVSARL